MEYKGEKSMTGQKFSGLSLVANMIYLRIRWAFEVGQKSEQDMEGLWGWA